MIRFLIQRPVAVLVTFTVAVILGLTAYQALPVSLMPDIPIPEVTVNVNYPNSTARELENSVVRPLRAQLLQAGHLKEIHSKTNDGSATIILRFDYGSDMDYAFIEINEKVDAIMPAMPREMERPVVIKASVTDIPVFYLNLRFKENLHGREDVVAEKLLELSAFAETVIRKRIEQLPEVALVDISGTVSPRVVVEPDMALLKSLGLTLQNIETALAENNISAGSMVIQDGHYRYNIRLSSLLRDRDDVAAIRLSAGGRILSLDEIANVELVPEKRYGMFLSDGREAVTMAIIKQSDARIAGMKNKIRELTERFEDDYPEISFAISQDQTRLLDYSIYIMKENLIEGLILVILVVVFFMSDFRLPLLIGLSLLVSVIIALLFFYLIGMSVNVISLAGLILAAGNMMDNSIVVTDNITQYRDRGFPIDDACVTGTNEVLVPQLSSMLVNVAVFVPLIFLSGIAGALMTDEALAVLIGLGVSYIVGITFMPVVYKLTYGVVVKRSSLFSRLYRLIYRRPKRQKQKQIVAVGVYEKGLDYVFRHKALFLTLFILLIPAGFVLLMVIEKEKMPRFSEIETNVTIDWNENIDIDENHRRVSILLELINDHITQSNAYIGRQQFVLNRDRATSSSETNLYLETTSTEELQLVIKIINEKLGKDYPGALVDFEPPMNTFEKIFAGSGAPLVAEVTMKNNLIAPDLQAFAALNRELNSDPFLRASNKIPLQDHLVIEPDLESLILYDVDYYDLITAIRTRLYENRRITIQSSTMFMPVMLRGREASLTEMLEDCTVMSRHGGEINVGSLVGLRYEQGLKTIVAGKEGEYLPLMYYPERREKDRFIETIENRVNQSSLFEVQFSGTLFSDIRLLKEMAVMLLISVLLLYFILAAQFESLLQPLLILAELPVDIGAALFTLLIAGQTLNIMSAIGIVVMTGILITDSILKLDAFNKLRGEGHSLDYVIREGGHRRFRAIVMTALTSILAVLPLLFKSDMGSELQKPFSYALIGGMTMGTIVSLYILPLLYWLAYRRAEPY